MSGWLDFIGESHDDVRHCLASVIVVVVVAVVVGAPAPAMSVSPPPPPSPPVIRLDGRRAELARL